LLNYVTYSLDALGNALGNVLLNYVIYWT
jgi:hypothetical protein